MGQGGIVFFLLRLSSDRCGAGGLRPLYLSRIKVEAGAMRLQRVRACLCFQRVRAFSDSVNGYSFWSVWWLIQALDTGIAERS